MEWLKTQNRANFTRQEKVAIVGAFGEQLKNLKEKKFNEQKQSLVKQSQPLWQKIEQHKAKEPLFFGKDKWQRTLDELIKNYNQIKDKFDKLKETGATKEHEKQALEQLKQAYPEQVKQVVTIDKALKAEYKIWLENKNKELAKSYNLTNKGEHYEVQQSYEIKLPNKSQELQKDR